MCEALRTFGLNVWLKRFSGRQGTRVVCRSQHSLLKSSDKRHIWTEIFFLFEWNIYDHKCGEQYSCTCTIHWLYLPFRSSVYRLSKLRRGSSQTEVIEFAWFDNIQRSLIIRWPWNSLNNRVFQLKIGMWFECIFCVVDVIHKKPSDLKRAEKGK